MLVLINNAYLLIKKKYIVLLIIVGIALPTIISKNIYHRQIGFFGRIQLYDQSSTNIHKEYVSIYKQFGHLKHFAHYDVAWQIFKDYPIFGVGNLKFRYVCHDKKYFNTEISYTNDRCSNHPHQVHFEILSEQGIVGYLIIVFAIFYVLFNGLRIYQKTGNVIHLSSILFVLTFFIPLLPTGSFFCYI